MLYTTKYPLELRLAVVEAHRNKVGGYKRLAKLYVQVLNRFVKFGLPLLQGPEYREILNISFLLCSIIS